MSALLTQGVVIFSMGPEQPSFLSRARERLARSLFRNNPSTESELAKVIQQASEDEVINEDTEDMIRGVFDISKRRIGDIMIPRSQIITIDQHDTIAKAISIVSEHGHSRYPVSVNDKDHIKGILMAKDLLPLAHEPERRLDEFPNLLHDLVIVPEYKRVNMMLKDFQQDRFHMAMVVDEYGGISGLVTIEDILEIIVGEISDEYDSEEPEQSNIVKTGEHTYNIRGATTLEEFQDFFKLEHLTNVDVDTVAGLVIHSLGHLPRKDESTTINDFTFKVLSSNPRQVHLLQVTAPKVDPEAKD